MPPMKLSYLAWYWIFAPGAPGAAYIMVILLVVLSMVLSRSGIATDGAWAVPAATPVFAKVARHRQWIANLAAEK
ncbi:MAG: hypothetical protein IPF57_14625 [Gammaproteobacteria bacterium]|nr:hypothetical protein [Gammaproteobacteria bacterium]